jgi:hypothetical protein
MRRWAQPILALWFAISMTMAQACITSPQSASYPGSHGSAALGSEPSPSIARSGSSSRTTSSENLPADTHIDTSGYSPDEAESRALTEYLTQHKLPLVGAQVLAGPAGQRAVVLYGFVGSEFGRNDAADKARRFTADPSMMVDNRIKVRPELLASGSRATAPDSGSSMTSEDASSPDESYPGVDSYAQQQNNALSQYQQNQSPGGSMGTMLPLIVMLGLLSMGLASGGSGFSVGPPMGGSPYGYPYNPYPGYPSPSPYGSPYAPSPYSGSPFGPPPMSPYYP